MARDSDTLSVSNIGGDLTVAGNVTSKGEINLDGHVRGDIHCVALVLGENSSVEGNVAADDVVILIGSVKALRVTLQSNSHVQGDLTHQSLAIEQGAFFDGKSIPSKNLLSTSQTIAEDSTSSEPQSVVARKRKEKRETAFVRSLPESD